MKRARKLASIVIILVAFGGVTVAWLQGGADPNRIALRYEPGKDTKASFGDGTIQIQRISIDRVYELVDLGKQHKTLIHQVQSYKESDSGDLVFVFGDHSTFAIINSRTNEYQIYNYLHEVPEHYRDIFLQLQQDYTIKSKIR